MPLKTDIEQKSLLLWDKNYDRRLLNGAYFLLC